MRNVYANGISVGKTMQSRPVVSEAADGDKARSESAGRTRHHVFQRSGSAQDYAEAVKWYQKAADQDDTPPKQARRHVRQGPRRNAGFEKAFVLIKKPRTAGCRGMVRPRFLYADGLGVPPNGASAAMWFRRPSGKCGCCVQSRESNRDGQGVPWDFKEAMSGPRGRERWPHRRAIQSWRIIITEQGWRNLIYVEAYAC